MTLVVRWKFFHAVHYTKPGMTSTDETVHIVGLKKGDFGRNCLHHQMCGETVEKDDLIVFKRCIIGKGLKLESCIAAVKLDDDGKESCRIGFLSKDLVYLNGFAKYKSSSHQLLS